MKTQEIKQARAVYKEIFFILLIIGLVFLFIYFGRTNIRITDEECTYYSYSNVSGSGYNSCSSSANISRGLMGTLMIVDGIFILGLIISKLDSLTYKSQKGGKV